MRQTKYMMQNNPNENIVVGSRVTVFDSSLFKCDVTTPLSTTMQPATVIQRYGIYSTKLFGKYADLVDVRFDHRPKDISHGHFTAWVKVIEVEKIETIEKEEN